MQAKVAIVGGGIAGLVAAARLARAGLQPCLFEAAPDVGGRAQTRVVEGFQFNQGPHALYLGGALHGQLKELGISVAGGPPRQREGVAIWGEDLHPWPVGRAAEDTPPLSPSEARCLADTLARIREGDYGPAGAPLGAFTQALPRTVGTVIEALVRLTSYAHAADEVDGKAALDQLRLAFAGAIYVHGGWRTLTSGLARAATGAGALLRTERAVAAIRRDGGRWRVEIVGEPAETFDAVIVATPPDVAVQLSGASGQIAAAAAAARPLRAVCLDLGLTSIAGSRAVSALGMDAPTYMAVHSESADLAPPGQALVHLSRFLAPDEAPCADHLKALERMADRLLPGWREREAERQRLVAIPVVHDYPRWRSGGRRAPPTAADAPGLFLAGDWVGEEGMLSDAAAASAVVAAREAVAYLSGVHA